MQKVKNNSTFKIFLVLFKNVANMTDYIRPAVCFLLFVTWFMVCQSKGNGRGSREIPSPDIDASPRIIGGVDAAIGEFPYMVMIGFDERFYCGGVIINEEWLLSAAHCFTQKITANRKGKTVKVFIGSIERGKTLRYRWVDDYIVHPRYNTSSEFGFHDIALVKLNQKINCESISYTCGPAMLPVCSRTNSYYKNKYTTLSGWGRTVKLDEDNPGPPENLQKVTLKVSLVHGLFIRTDGTDGGACVGDSGGPMTLEETGEVVGIISSADPNCDGHTTCVRLDYYLDWIHEAQFYYYVKDQKTVPPYIAYQ